MNSSRPPRPHPGTAYFASIGDEIGDEYLRYAFTKGTAQEIDFLLEVLRPPRGGRVLDVGCGPGRHSLELARRGYHVTGVDVSGRFLEMARAAAAAEGLSCSFFQMDARSMPFADEFDVVLSLCQGGFGLMGDDDGVIAKGMTTAARSGGWVVVSTFNGYFEAHTPRAGVTLDIDSGVVHEETVVRTEGAGEKVVDLWTSVYTPRELRLLSIGVGLVPVHVWSVEAGNYKRLPPNMDEPELMLIARKP